MTDVPINPVTRRVQFTGNTGTGPYAFTFNILQASDIAVFKNTATLTLTNDYTVAINANGTGSVTLVAALISTDLLTITGGRELSRTTDFVTGGPLLAGTLNEQLDSNVIMSQQLDEKFDRSLKIAQSDFTANLTLPIKSVRANQLLGFDASGNAVAGTGSTLNLTVANLTASSLTIPIGGSTVIEGFSFDSGKISTTITNDSLELYSNGTGTVIASPSLTVDNLKLDGNTFSSIDTNGNINIFPNGSGIVNMDAELMVYGNDVNGAASYVSISPSATGGDDLRLQGVNAGVSSYDTSSVSAQVPSMLGSFSLYGLDTSGNYIAYATLRGYAEDPFAGTNGKEGSLRIQINDDSSIREHKFTATGLDVYNNITLSGTVDGRDIASDGSKLDGITANATTYSFSDTNGTVTVTPAQGSAATLIIGTAAGSGGLAMRGNAGGADSVALGTSSNAIGVNAITIGKSATTSTGSNSPTNGIAIGEQAHSYGSGTTALGRQASSIGDNSIALGSYASVPATYHSSVALGYQATVNAANQIMLGRSNETVKIPGILNVDGNIVAGGTVDGRDIATDGTKLNTIETNADVTDAANVDAAGALMKSGGAMTGAITTNSTFDTRDVATDGTKLDTIETNADVTDATNVNAAGAVMVSDTSTSGMGFVIDEDNMGSNSVTKIPTQQSVKAYVDSNVSSSVQYRGGYNAATNSPNLDSSPSGITIGDMYTTTVAGTFYSTGLEIGDVLIAEVDDPSSVNDWTIVQQNLDAAEIKTLYESNADTNAFDDAEQTRLAGIEAGAEVNIGQYFMISANSQGVANGEIITTHPNASGQTSEVIDFTGAGALTVARSGNNLTFTGANTTYGFADSNGTVTITPSTGSAATLVIGTAAGSGGLAFRGNAGGANSIALGTSSNSMGINSIIIGNDAESTASGSGNSNNIGIGYQAHPYGANAIAIGYQAVAAGASGTALGPYANVPSSYYNSTALGISATVTASNQIMLGTSGTAVNVPGTLSATGNSTFAGTLTATGAVTAATLQTTAGGTVTTASGNDLNIVYPDSRSLFFKEGSTTTLTLDNTQNATFASTVTAAGVFVTGGSNTASKLTFTNTAPTPDNVWSIHPIYNGQDLLLQEDGVTRVKFDSSGIDVTGNVVVSGTVDGRDVATDGTKLDGIEASADVTDTANVTAAGALMDSELTNLAAVKAINQSLVTTASPEFDGLSVDYLQLDGSTFSSTNTNGDINIFPNGSGAVNFNADLMVYGNDINGAASYVQISASGTGGDDIRLQGSNPVVASYDTSNVSAQVPSMLGALQLYGKDTSGNYIAYATLRGYAEDPFAGTNGKEGSLRIQINDDSSIREHKFTATGLDVYNDITLSGTVDGRNVSADGTKLDGIAAGANNYTFPYTVSGGESASTVAQRNSSGYLHAYYFNGSGTFATSGASSGMGNFTGTNGSDTYGRSYNAAAARALLNVENGATADQTAAQILTAIKTVDGASSGLDADLLDGQQGSYYVANGGTDELRTIPNRWYANASASQTLDYYQHNYAKAHMGNTFKYTTSRPNITTDANYWIGSMGWGAIDLNTIFSYGSGFWDAWSLSSHNRPSSYTTHWQGFNSLHYSLSTTNQHGMQMAMGVGDPSHTYLRGQWGSSVRAWQKIWTDGNDGSGSGLDADLLDGQQGSYYAPIATPSFTSYITVPEIRYTSAQNMIMKSGSTGSSTGLKVLNSSGTFQLQLYGNGSNYGFLGSSWGNWDLQKAVSGKLYLNNNTTYYLQPDGSTKLDSLTTTYLEVTGGTTYIRGNLSVPTVNTSISTVSHGTSANWYTAYTWGNHANAGYITGVVAGTGLSGGATSGSATLYTKVREMDPNNDGNSYGYGPIICGNISSSTSPGSSGLNYAAVGDFLGSGLQYSAYYAKLYTWNGQFNGTLYYGSLSQLSDERVKDNITPISGALATIKQIEGVTYTLNTNNDKPTAGIIAQKLEAILPNLVETADPEGDGSYQPNGITDRKSIDYIPLIAYLVEAVKELTARVETLEG